MPMPGSGLLRGFARGFGPAFQGGFNQSAALQRALVAAGELGLVEEPIMRRSSVPQISPVTGAPVVMGPGGRPITGSTGEIMPGTEIPPNTFMEEPTGRMRTRLAPTGMSDIRKSVLLAGAGDKQAAREMAKERLAMQYASSVSDMFKDPEAFNQAYMSYKKKLDVLSGLQGIMGSGMPSADAMGMGVEEPVTEGVGEEGDVDQEVDFIMQLPEEQQTYVIDNLGEDDYAIRVKERIKQLMAPEEVPGSISPRMNAVPSVRSRLPGTTPSFKEWMPKPGYMRRGLFGR